jgi:hypothetical protein
MTRQGVIIGAAASLIGTFLNNRHNMVVKKQELEHSLSIELLKHRIDCYALAIKYLETSTYFSPNTPIRNVQELSDNLTKWEEQEKGGLLMSRNSLNTYISIKEEILEIRKSKISKEANISQENADRLRRAIFSFRMSLKGDIGTSEE